MTKRPPWVVFVPGDKEWVEQRVRDYFDELDLDENVYSFQPCSARYHAIFGIREVDIGIEGQLAEKFSMECTETVYAIDLAADQPSILAFLKGVIDVEEIDPDELASYLGCALPKLPETPRSFPVMRSLALIEGVDSKQALSALKEELGGRLPRGFNLIETQRGLLVYSDAGDIGFAAITISERFPDAITYSIIASSGLSLFHVRILQRGGCVGHFDIPVQHDPFSPALPDIKGETSPKKILRLLGIPTELFH